jgi:hypothetical protein
VTTLREAATEYGRHDPNCVYDHEPLDVGINSEFDEHFCHSHPIGLLDGEELIRYWCGHTCADAPCRRYKAVWMVTHIRAVIGKLRRKEPRAIVTINRRPK